MARDNSEGHQFGVAPFEQDRGVDDAFGRYQTSILPLPEDANLQFQEAQERNEENAILQEARDRDAELAWSQKPDQLVGNVTKPKENTLGGYKSALRQGGGVNGIEFSPDTYGAFDAVIVQKCGIDEDGKSTHPAFNKDNPNYQSYAPLRRNLAILRNYLLVQYFPDGIYFPVGDKAASKEDEENLKKIQSIAEKLGKKLGAGTPKTLLGRWWQSIKRLFSGKSLAAPNTSVLLEASNGPDVGIATLYDTITKMQANDAGELFGANPSNWNLLPREQTPFSDEDMEHYKNSSRMNRVANAFEYTTRHFKSVDTLSQKDKDISVEHAREILEKLRIKLSNGMREFNAEVGDVRDERQEIAHDLLRATEAFRGETAAIARYNPELLRNNKALADAADVIGKIAYRVRADVVNMLREEGNIEAADKMAARLAKFPEKFKSREDQIPLNELIKMLDSGLSEAQQIVKRSGIAVSYVREQNMPPPPQPPKKPDPKSQALSAVHGGKYDSMTNAKTMAINNENLRDAAIQANNPPQIEPKNPGDPKNPGLYKV